MYLENIVFDALEPKRLGQFYEAALGGEQLTDEPEGYETRIVFEGGMEFDLCFQHVAEKTPAPPRLQIDLAAGAGQASGQLVDPEGNPYGVREEPGYDGPARVAAFVLDSADPDRDSAFWSWLTGWTEVAGVATPSLRHPSQHGPLLELRAESSPKGDAKNPVHLDVRLEFGEDPDVAAAGIVEHGGRELHLGFGDLPWRHYADPSGNEFCVLPAPSAPPA